MVCEGYVGWSLWACLCSSVSAPEFHANMNPSPRWSGRPAIETKSRARLIVAGGWNAAWLCQLRITPLMMKSSPGQT